MTKKSGFLITATYFLPIDKKNFAAQAATFSAIAEIEKTGALPADFAGTVISVKAKQGSADIPDAPQTASDPDKADPASWPLTSDPLPADAAVIEATTDLAGHIFQTLKLADGTETFRRVTAEQDQAERDADARLAEATGGKKK